MPSAVKSFCSSLWQRLRGTYGVDLIPEAGAASGSGVPGSAVVGGAFSSSGGVRRVGEQSFRDSGPASGLIADVAGSDALRTDEYADRLLKSLSEREIDEARDLAISGWRALQAMPNGVRLSGELAFAVNAGDVEAAVDILRTKAGYRRIDATAFVSAFMIVMASGRRVGREAEEASRECRRLIARGLPALDQAELSMLWEGRADAARLRYQRRSGASDDDADMMIRLAAKMAAAEGKLPR